jgi:hypothetical protein
MLRASYQAIVIDIKKLRLFDPPHMRRFAEVARKITLPNRELLSRVVTQELGCKNDLGDIEIS